MEKACFTEIVELHRFFEEWFHGTREGAPAGMARFSTVMADDFEIISPDGVLIRRGDLIEIIEETYGAFGQAAFRIRVEDPCFRVLAPELFLVTNNERKGNRDG